MYDAENRRSATTLSFALLLIAAACGSAAAQTVSVNNTSQYSSSGRYKWTIYLETDPSTLRDIKYVEYRLPPSFENEAVQKSDGPRAGRYPFSYSNYAVEPFSVKVTVFFKNGQSRELPTYTLALTDPISYPAGVAVTSIYKLKQRNQTQVWEPEFVGRITVAVDDIHGGSKASNLQVRNTQTSEPLAAITVVSKVHVPFKFEGKSYVLEGYTKTDILHADYLFFKIYRLPSR